MPLYQRFGSYGILEAIKAGVDGLDVCVSSLSMGPSLPPIETFIAALKGSIRDPKIDLSLFDSINKDIKEIRKKYSDFETKLIGVDVGCLQHQIPGGMLSNLESQLKGMGMSDRLAEVLTEVEKVRADMGYPPLATPSSQMCGVQATMNIMSGNRYSMIPNEVKNYCRGKYGLPPGPVSEELITKALGDEKPAFVRPGDLLEPGMPVAKEKIHNLARSEEDIITYALFPNETEAFLKAKYGI